MSHTGVIDPGSPFVTGTYTITRRAQPTWSNGIKVAGATSTIAGVSMSVQPVARRTRTPVEGESLAVTHTAYSQTELIPRSPTSDGDIVTYDGETYLVLGCVRWQAFGETHYIAELHRQVTP